MEKDLDKALSRRSFLKAAAVGATLVGSGAPFLAQRALAKDTIKYGTMYPLTGVYSALGLDQQRATELAVDEWNARGGVLGRKVVLVSRDDQLNGAVALRRTKELVEEEKCDFIGGTLSGFISLAINEFACKNKIIYVCYSQSDMVLGSDQCKYGFAFMMIPYSAALAASKYAFEKLGKNWFSITADHRWGQSLLEGWMWQSEQMGGKFLGNVFTPLGATDFTAHFPKIMAAKPDFIVLNNFGTDQTAAIKQASELGLTKKMKIVISKTTLVTIKECGSAYDENIIGGTNFDWKLRDK
jgi:branched-chain amino acid transport system substrate-binding protein